MSGLTVFQRDALIAHLDGPAPLIIAPRDRETAALMRETHRLAARGFLRYDRPDRPRATIITESGRMLLARALADWADALARAGGGVEVETSADRRATRWRIYAGVNGSLTMPAVASATTPEAQCSGDPPTPCPADAGPTAGSSAASTGTTQ